MQNLNSRKTKKAKAFEEELKRGHKFYQEGQFDLAIKEYQKILTINPKYIKAWLFLVKTYKSQGAWDEVINCYGKVLSFQPISPHPYIELAKCFEKQGKVDLAIVSYQNAIEIEPNLSLKIYEKLAKLLKKIGRVNESYKYMNYMLTKEPNNSYILYELGKLLEIQQDWENAYVFYQKSNFPGITNRMIKCAYNNKKIDMQSTFLEIKDLLKNSKTVKYIQDEILSKLQIKYSDFLILFQPASNVGDTCKQFALVQPLCLQHNCKAIVFYPQAYSPITQAHLFFDSITPKHIVSHFAIDERTCQKIKQLTREDKISLDRIPVIPGIPRIMNNVPESEKITYITDESMYSAGKASSLGINLELNDITLGKPKISQESFKNALNKFNMFDLIQGKSILIAPYSVFSNSSTGSNTSLVKFWKNLIRFFLRNNITPVVNSRHRQENLDNYLSSIIPDMDATSKHIPFVDLSLDEVIPFVELCGSFAGVRSGLCDLTAFSSKQTIKLCIQPHNSGKSEFKKLPPKRVIDNTLINDNFQIYNLNVNQIPENQEIQQVFYSVFSNLIQIQ